MSDTKHTPGPWDIEWPTGDSRIAWLWDRPPLTDAECEAGRDRNIICSFAVLSDTDAANLRLLAAAPLLYAACEDALDVLQRIEDDPRPAHARRYPASDRLRAAIAAATEDANENQL